MRRLKCFLILVLVLLMSATMATGCSLFTQNPDSGKEQQKEEPINPGEQPGENPGGEPGDPVTEKYTITFMNGDTVLLEIEVDENVTPAYLGAVPTKESTNTVEYRFSGWVPSLVPATQDAVYQAGFIDTVRKYTVEFVDDEITEEIEFEYQAQLTTPNWSKPGYDLSWDNELVSPVTVGAKYTAVWTPRNDTVYSVVAYQEQEDGTYIDVTSTIFAQSSFVGTTGAVVDFEENAKESAPQGFAFAATKQECVYSGTIAGDGSLVLSLYYAKLRSYTVNHYTREAIGSVTLQDTETLEGVGVVEADANEYEGYVFNSYASTTQLEIVANEELVLNMYYDIEGTEFHNATEFVFADGDNFRLEWYPEGDREPRPEVYRFVRERSLPGPNIQIPYSTAHIENYDYLVFSIYWLYHETPLYSAGLGGNPVTIYNYKFEEVDINATNKDCDNWSYYVMDLSEISTEGTDDYAAHGYNIHLRLTDWGVARYWVAPYAFMTAEQFETLLPSTEPEGPENPTNPQSGTYTVNHYVHKIDGTYELKETETFTGEGTVTATQKEYAGYAFNPYYSTASGAVLEDNSLVLNMFYNVTGVEYHAPTEFNFVDHASDFTFELDPAVTEHYVRENGYKFVRSTSAAGPNIQIPYSTAHIENYDYLVLPIYWLYHETPLYSDGLAGNPVKIYNYKFEEVDINATNKDCDDWSYYVIDLSTISTDGTDAYGIHNYNIYLALTNWGVARYWAAPYAFMTAEQFNALLPSA